MGVLVGTERESDLEILKVHLIEVFLLKQDFAVVS